MQLPNYFLFRFSTLFLKCRRESTETHNNKNIEKRRKKGLCHYYGTRMWLVGSGKMYEIISKESENIVIVHGSSVSTKSLICDKYFYVSK